MKNFIKDNAKIHLLAIHNKEQGTNGDFTLIIDLKEKEAIASGFDTLIAYSSKVEATHYNRCIKCTFEIYNTEVIFYTNFVYNKDFKSIKSKISVETGGVVYDYNYSDFILNNEKQKKEPLQHLEQYFVNNKNHDFGPGFTDEEIQEMMEIEDDYYKNEIDLVEVNFDSDEMIDELDKAVNDDFPTSLYEIRKRNRTRQEEEKRNNKPADPVLVAMLKRYHEQARLYYDQEED